MSCARLLDLLVAEAVKYVESVPAAADAIHNLEERVQGILDNRRWVSGARHGFNDFGETDLESAVAGVEAVLDLLPKLPTQADTSEDAPLPFVVADIPDHIEALATSPEFAQAASYVATLVIRVRSMLADPRLAPVIQPEEDPTLVEWLSDYVESGEEKTSAVTVIDLSLVPADVVHLVVAVIARLVFEALHRYLRQTGQQLPTVMVLEEAHTFVQRSLSEETAQQTPARMCRETFERIAREGRKFGLGLVLSSQRPSEVSPTVLAQCNTFLLHRLVNDRDQDLVGRLVPDNLGGLLRELPSLPSRQAILLGWAAPLPTLTEVRFLEPAHRPRSDDPAFWSVWTGEGDRRVDWAPIVSEWTGAGPATSGEQNTGNPSPPGAGAAQ
jgi:hypothetical protein